MFEIENNKRWGNWHEEMGGLEIDILHRLIEN